MQLAYSNYKYAFIALCFDIFLHFYVTVKSSVAYF